MSAELRNVIPYFSKLQLILNDGTIEVPVEDKDGARQIGTFKLNSAIFAEILGYNPLDPTNPVFADSAEFPARRASGDTTSIIMEDVLGAAKTAGFDVVELLDDAFDQIAEEFVATKGQPEGTAVLGPVVIYRPDAFFADLHPTRPKSVTIKVGVYSAKKESIEGGGFKWVTDKLKTNRYIIFEDTLTKDNRAAQAANMVQQRTSSQEYVVALNQVITAKTNDDPLPENFPYPGLADRTIVQLQSEVADQTNRIAGLTASINELNNVVSGDMSKLIPQPDENGDINPTPLQGKVIDAVKGLCIAILLTLKSSRDDWSGINVEEIMNRFYLPPV